MSVKVDSVLISMTTVGCAPQQAHMLRAARTHTHARATVPSQTKKKSPALLRGVAESYGVVFPSDLAV